MCDRVDVRTGMGWKVREIRDDRQVLGLGSWAVGGANCGYLEPTVSFTSFILLLIFLGNKAAFLLLTLQVKEDRLPRLVFPDYNG